MFFSPTNTKHVHLNIDCDGLFLISYRKVRKETALLLCRPRSKQHAHCFSLVSVTNTFSSLLNDHQSSSSSLLLLLCVSRSLRSCAPCDLSSYINKCYHRYIVVFVVVVIIVVVAWMLYNMRWQVSVCTQSYCHLCVQRFVLKPRFIRLLEVSRPSHWFSSTNFFSLVN